MRILSLSAGGGFGVKGEVYPEDFLIPWAAKQLGRPISWIEDRRENLLAANHSREQHHDATIAASADGRIVAFVTRFAHDAGAYVRTVGVRVAELTIGGIPGPYDIPNYSATGRYTLTNKTPTGTYRSPGGFEATFVCDRMIDLLAAQARQGTRSSCAGRTSCGPSSCPTRARCSPSRMRSCSRAGTTRRRTTV